MTIKAVYFDMDGTIADLFGVENWLGRLRNYDASPYAEAGALVDLEKLAALLDKLGKNGVRRGVISWGSMVSTPAYNTATKAAKIYWLHRRNLQNRFDEIHVVKYGTPKHLIPNPQYRGGVLIDDTEDVRTAWEKHGGITINAKNPNWLEELIKMCE